MSHESASEIADSALQGVRSRLDSREAAALQQLVKVEAAIDALGDELEDQSEKPWPTSDNERRQHRRQLHENARRELAALTTAITEITQRSTLDPIAIAVADFRERERSALPSPART